MEHGARAASGHAADPAMSSRRRIIRSPRGQARAMSAAPRRRASWPSASRSGWVGRTRTRKCHFEETTLASLPRHTARSKALDLRASGRRHGPRESRRCRALPRPPVPHGRAVRRTLEIAGPSRRSRQGPLSETIVAISPQPAYGPGSFGTGLPRRKKGLGFRTQGHAAGTTEFRPIPVTR